MIHALLILAGIADAAGIFYMGVMTTVKPLSGSKRDAAKRAALVAAIMAARPKP